MSWKKRISLNCRRCNKPDQIQGMLILSRGLCGACWGIEVEKGFNNVDTKLSIVDMAWDSNTRDVRFRRDEINRQHFNIPHIVKFHSPDGMSWGYAGSGPADFALNILEVFMRDYEYADVEIQNYGGAGEPKKLLICRSSWLLHQEFKRQFIQNKPEKGGIIRGSVIREWIEAKLEESKSEG
jgi:hypothetical protein